MLNIDRAICDTSSVISKNIDRFDSSERGLLSQNILSQLRNLVEYIAEKVMAGGNDIDPNDYKLKEDAVAQFDVMADQQVQCFVGSRSAQENLKLIPANQMPKLNPLKESDRAILLEGLDGVISQNLQDKIWDMIWKRWCYYEDFCHSRRDG